MSIIHKCLAVICTIVCLLTQGCASRRFHIGKRTKTHHTISKKNIPRSSLVTINPEDLIKEVQHPANVKDVQGSRKSDMKEVNLPTMEESQRMTDMSRRLSKLPPGEEGVVADFLKDMERSHGNLTPAVMRKMARLEGYQPQYNRRGQRQMQLFKGRTQNQQGSLRSLESFTPTTAMNPSVLPFKLGNTQETFSNTESDLGEENPSYTSNPMPEYDYKELKYNLPTTTDNDVNYDYHNDESEDYSKNLAQDFDGDFEGKTGGGGLREQASEGVGSLVGKKGDSLINEIGRRVLLNIIQKQNEESKGEKNAKNIPELLGAASVNPVEGTNSFNSERSESLPSHNEGSVLLSSLEQKSMHDSPSQNFNSLQNLISSNQAMHSINSSPSNQDIAKVIAQLGMKALAKTKLAVLQEPQRPVENELNSKVSGDTSPLPVSDVTVGGKVNHIIDSAKASSTQVTTKPTLTATTLAQRSEDSKVNSDVVDSNKEDVVILKISGQGKPISFRADTSKDGSLVLKIPKKYSEKIIQADDIQGTATVTKSDGAAAHPGDVSQDVSTLLAGKNPRNGLFEGTTQISDWEISGKKNEGNKEFQGQNSLTDFHPTRNVLPSDPKQTIRLPSLEGLLKSGQESLPSNQANLNQNPKALVQSPLPNSPGQTVPKDQGTLADTTQMNLAHSIFPNVAGVPPNLQNMEQMMTLLTHMEELPSTQVGATPYDGTIPTNYGVRQDVGRQDDMSLKNFLKSSKLVEDTAVTRNKGTQKGIKKENADNQWSPCTVTCGRGIQARARPCKGQDCSGFTTESRPCNPGPCPEQLAKAGLKLHNKFRIWHNSPALKWSPPLAKKAQKLANELARNNDSAMESLEMNELPGENLAVVKDSYRTAAETAVKQWYGEVKGYSFAHPSLDDSTKHFSQIVWKGTKKAGIGLAKSKTTNKTYVVALYDPPGNMEGKEKNNILIPDMART